MVTAWWADVASGKDQGKALFIRAYDRQCALHEADLADPTAVHGVVLSIWEGVRGHCPASRFARWRWNRGASRLHRSIIQVIRPLVAERESLSV